MYRISIVLALCLLAAGASWGFSYATGACASGGCATTEDFLASNANELDAALDALELRDTIAEHESVDGVNVILETEMDASSELRALIDDETGTGLIVFQGGDIGSATATTPTINDSDTSVATTAFVQGESVAAGDVTGSIGGGLTIGANAVALATDTTGNYVATVADSGASEITVSGSGTGNAPVTLGLAAGITRDSELHAYTVSTATPVDGSTACNTGDMWLETDAFKVYFCTDGGTDKWYGIQLVDTP